MTKAQAIRILEKVLKVVEPGKVDKVEAIWVQEEGCYYTSGGRFIKPKRSGIFYGPPEYFIGLYPDDLIADEDGEGQFGIRGHSWANALEEYLKMLRPGLGRLRKQKSIDEAMVRIRVIDDALVKIREIEAKETDRGA